MKLEPHETRKGKDLKNILKYCYYRWLTSKEDEDRPLIQTSGLEAIISSVRTVLLECKAWKCDSLQDKQKQRWGIQQKTICIIIFSSFSILPMPWSVCTILSIQRSIKYSKNQLPILECGECVEISSKVAQTASGSSRCL